LLQATHAIFEHQLALIVDPMQFDASEPLPSPEHYLYWALIGQRQRFAWPRTLRCCRTGQRSAYAAPPSQRTGRPRALFAATPVQSLALLTVRQTRIASWPTGRITALGDAVHAMSPASGRL
jgi:2-polyprenyl-6-methoxyphenol hydroxylase-like FAD-dependent oxidoreductase